MPKKSLRKPGWDYSSTANYFITLNLAFNSSNFGSISTDGIALNELGELVKAKWENLPVQVPNLTLGEFVIMPDHIHGIVYFEATQDENKTTTGKFGAQRKNLPSAIRGFKAAFTSLARPLFPSFEWQKGYHDRILFSKSDEVAVINYIRNNPIKAIEKLNSVSP